MLADWVCTCTGCPTQFEGHLDTGEYIYFRYRWGYATLEIARTERDWWADTLMHARQEKIGDEWAGVLGDWEVRSVITPWIEEYKRNQHE